MVRYLKGGCGLENCRAKGITVWAVQMGDNIPRSQPDANALKRPPQRAGWTDVLLRTKEGAASFGLPSTEQYICRTCETDITTDEDPRWTIESLPCYIPRRPRCIVCENTCTNRRPEDASIQWVDAAALSKKWT
ncbi:hypothetical protein GGS23DRAFT_558798 [Durotheca rogersii]|uniref:uncharacterized protein n=1 Tax=Durotheca rogersii TaxID=419775 RepID=UPI002220EF08|nr:uncharacterized protein GGS23DRAFT_558798 [Durotheca rogersii]KAI5865347.1 hypothetical protein GGS23DRAFT_558798 [Durotheca rogersii]